jgi:hypothetical protein
MQLAWQALAFAFESAGNSSDARIAMMAMTTSNSMSVKPAHALHARVVLTGCLSLRFP